jgi:hypothetical protein
MVEQDTTTSRTAGGAENEPVGLCLSANRLYARWAIPYQIHLGNRKDARLGTKDGSRYDSGQTERLRQIHERLIEARRELDALIGDAYLRPRASIVPVHFLDLASAVEKLRWAEKEWRELDKELDDPSSKNSNDEPLAAVPAPTPGS